MTVENCNPFIRAAEIQPTILEGSGLRMAYDHRLFYILENRGRITIDRRSWDIGPNTLIVIPPATAYDFHGKLKTCVLNFDITRKFSHRSHPIFPPCTAAFDPSLLFDTQLLEGFEHPCILQGDIFTQETVLRIVNRYNAHGKHADAAISAMLKLLFSELLDRSTDSGEKRCEEIMSYIRIHAAEINNNEAVARVFGYHPVYLSDLIKRTLGKSLHATIMEAKLQLACRWLAGTDESIDDIAHQTGFCSRAHFCTLFKKKLGVSPTEYRKNR